MRFWLYVSFPKEYEIIELDPEKLNLEKVFIIKNPKADGLTKGWEEMLDLQCFLLITLFFHEELWSSFSLTQLPFLGLFWCEILIKLLFFSPNL